MSDREIRMFAAELRAGMNEGEPSIEGYAAMYDQWTRIGGSEWGWNERIRPGFFENVVGSDVRVLVNHDPNLLLARTKAGTAVIESTDTGLRYRAKLDPDDPEAMKWYRRIERGDIDGCSFAFSVAEEGDEWYRNDDGDLCRDLMAAGELYDVGPVTFPAYEQTAVSARAKATADSMTTREQVGAAPTDGEEAGAAPETEPEVPDSYYLHLKP